MGRIGFLALAATVLLAGCGISLDGRLTSVIEGVATYRGSIDTGGDTRSVALFGNRAYVFDRADADDPGGARVQIIDVSDLTNPQHVTDLTAGADLRLKTFQHSNGSTYLMLLSMHGPPAVMLYDLSDPDAPGYVSELDLFDVGALDVRVVDDLAYIVGDGFAIVDLSDPAVPVILSEISLPSDLGGHELCLLGDHVYVATGQSGMIIIDASTAGSPEVLLTDTQFGWVEDVELIGTDRLLVSDGYTSSYLVNPINTPVLDPGPAAILQGMFSEPSPQGSSPADIWETMRTICYRTYGVQLVGAMEEIVQVNILAAPGTGQDTLSWMNEVMWGNGGVPFYAVAHGSQGLVLFEAILAN